MKGIIFINSFLDKEEYLYQPKRLQQEFSALGVCVEIQKTDRFPFCVENGRLQSALTGYDFCIFYDKDKYILQCLQATQIPIFNSCSAILTCDDKMLTYLALANHGIRMPKTLPGLICFSPDAVIQEETYATVEQKLGYPVIVKESYGSLGKGVYLARNRKELTEILQKVKCKPHLLQEFVATSYGKDVRVMVIGGKVIGGMLRQSNGDFRSNLGAGGRAEAYTPSAQMIATAERIASVLNLDYCGIDFLLTEDCQPIVCEVNSNAFFYGFETCTKINVAKLYAQHVLQKISKK